MTDTAPIRRRGVLVGLGAAVSAASLSGPAGAATPPPKLEARAAAPDSQDDGTLTWMAAWKIREMIGKREVSPVEVTNHFLNRIEAFDPILHAFYKVDYAGAREQAKRAERAVLSNEPLGPLHGIPVSFKGNVPVKGLPAKLPVGGGERLGDDLVLAPRDSIAAERVRRAGGIIVGSTWVLFGPKSPWDLSREPGVSSSGNAAAAAAGMVPLTIGTDGGGSTRLPAAISGLVGLHSTRGRVPSINFRDAAPSIQQSVGPLTRNVRDAAILFQVIAGPDGRDFICLQDTPPSYTAHLDDGAEGVRLAWTDDFGFASKYATPETPRVIAAVRQAAMSFTAGGAKVEPTGEVWEDPEPVQGADAGDAFVAMLDARNRCWATFRRVFEKHDFLLSPTYPHTAPITAEWGFRRDFRRYYPEYTSNTRMNNWLGLPGLSVPAGFVDNLPVGLQIIGPPNSEAKLLQLGQAFLKIRRA